MEVPEISKKTMPSKKVKMVFGCKYKGRMIPDAWITTEDSYMIRKLRKLVFGSSGSELMDHFMDCVVRYVSEKNYPTLTEMLSAEISLLDPALQDRFFYTNPVTKKRFIDRDMYTWAKIVCRLLDRQIQVMESKMDPGQKKPGK